MDDSILERIRHGALGRLLLLAGLVLLLRIPVERIDALVGEREEHRESAEAEVRGSWGPARSIPPLARPVLPRPRRSEARGPSRPRSPVGPRSPRRHRATAGHLRRALYDADLTVSASFRIPEAAALSTPTEDADGTRVTLEVGDAEARFSPLTVRADGNDVAADREGAYVLDAAAGELLEVTYRLELRGSENLTVRPRAGMALVELESDRPHPSFFGTALSSSAACSRDSTACSTCCSLWKTTLW